jgi:hypothetical protein
MHASIILIITTIGTNAKLVAFTEDTTLATITAVDDLSILAIHANVTIVAAHAALSSNVACDCHLGYTALSPLATLPSNQTLSSLPLLRTPYQQDWGKKSYHQKKKFHCWFCNFKQLPFCSLLFHMNERCAYNTCMMYLCI